MWLLILGAAIAVFGGVLGYEYNAWRDSCRELKSIKVSLCDELGDIESTIKSMHEVWDKSKTLYPSYLETLQQNTTAFDGLRERLFLIGESALRKKVVDYYRKLKDAVKEYQGKIGSLANTDQAKAEQANIAAAFKTLETEAKNIREGLE
ncbi:MAG: hypothetical protein PHZ00_02100 [Candidatus Peribacteraceae bacterium]|nr:hypothetical protein [Candidatus Peribacteraceae bacterium]